MRDLFRALDNDDCYPHGVQLYADARRGDMKAVRAVLDSRQTYEYEGWRLDMAVDPA